MTPDVMDQKAIVEANGGIRFDQILVGWTDSNFRNLHGHSKLNVTVSSRCGMFSNDLAFCAYPARAMMAQEPTMATANQMMPLKWPAKPVLFPHGDQLVNDAG
jgi:hypothetical protein